MKYSLKPSGFASLNPISGACMYSSSNYEISTTQSVGCRNLGHRICLGLALINDDVTAGKYLQNNQEHALLGEQIIGSIQG